MAGPAMMLDVAPPADAGRCIPPLLHDAAPSFSARTTMGDRRLSDYAGRWLLLFSHPADFTAGRMYFVQMSRSVRLLLSIAVGESNAVQSN